MEKTAAKTEEVAGRSLLDLVFSWSIRDVLNRDLYKNQILLKQDQSWHELRLDPYTFLWKGLDQIDIRLIDSNWKMR
ncbi:hypothetical protein D5086_031217 [Populus alba]|uniref:Uncharacterized protein n=1 Tax=Populus alba TaxID=43335 RepID=A0ACC4ARJ0_POPAL